MQGHPAIPQASRREEVHLSRAHHFLVTTLVFAALLAWPIRTSGQAPFVIVQHGHVDQRLIPAVERSFLASAAYLERLDGSFKFRTPPTIHLCATVELFIDTLVANGLTRDVAEQASRWLWGQHFADGMALNLQNISPLEPNIPWVIAHGSFHIYQWQRDVARLAGSSFFMREGTAEVFKLKVLEAMRIINFGAYVKEQLVPQAKAAHRRYPTFSLLQPHLGSLPETTPFYRLVSVAAAYLFDHHGGWEKIVQYFSSEVTPHDARFEQVFGVPLVGFEKEFFSWLDRQ